MKKIRHKTEGWTGTLETEYEEERASSSHHVSFRVTYSIWQDSHKPDGTYVEDPHIDSLDELEVIDEDVPKSKPKGQL